MLESAKAKIKNQQSQFDWVFMVTDFEGYKQMKIEQDAEQK